MKIVKKKESELPHYYICSECAKKNGGKWPKNHCATMHQDVCPYCKESKGLCAVTDWLWKDQKTLRVWD